MARGDGGKVIFENDQDRKGFLFHLGQVCECCGWRVHTWVLMDDHFHLLVETPEANLATGTKLLLGSFSQRWNWRRLRRGHVFQGRYESIPVNASASDPYCFRVATIMFISTRRGLGWRERAMGLRGLLLEQPA
jgi:putative transposase